LYFWNTGKIPGSDPWARLGTRDPDYSIPQVRVS
jgi:hypothetical protein